MRKWDMKCDSVKETSQEKLSNLPNYPNALSGNDSSIATCDVICQQETNYSEFVSDNIEIEM